MQERACLELLVQDSDGWFQRLIGFFFCSPGVKSTKHKERNFLTFWQLGALAISAALERAGCPKEAVDEVYMGAVLQVH